jgi:putative inorganic carbon (HCO3(-)) transporter
MGFFFTVVYAIASLLRPWELYPELKDYRFMLVLGVLCGLAVVWDVLSGATVWLRAPQTYLMVAFVAWLGISVALNGWLGGALRAWSEFSTTALVFLFTAVTVRSLKRLKVFAIAIVCSTLVIGAQGIAAYHFGYRSEVLLVREGSHDGDDDDASEDQPLVDDAIHIRRIRSVGFLNDPNDLAQALLLSLPLLAATWRRGRLGVNLFLVVIPTAILLYATYLTFSRGALIALGVIVFMLAKERWGSITASITGVGLGTIGLLAKVDAGRGFSTSEASAAGRIDAWSLGLQLLRQHPLAGVGFNQFTEYNDLTAHNSYVLCFAELGAVGYFLWLAIIVVSTLQIKRLRTASNAEDDELARWASAIQQSLFALLASSFFLSRTYSPTLYMFLGVITAFYGFASKHTIVAAPRFWGFGWRTAAAGLSSIAGIYGFIVATHLLGQ